jgi:hypothetical protein
MAHTDIVFDGPPSHISGRFIEVEDAAGKSIKFGEWVERDDGNWVLRIPADARLIAAAPDLVAELERAAGALTEAANLLRPTLKGCAGVMDNHAAIARAAIAKATGEAG